MTSGYPSDAIEASVQANIVAAKYATTSLNTAALTVGNKISLRATTPGYDTRYIAHSGSTVNTQVVTSSSATSLKQQASWTVRTGLGNSGCYSFESVDTPGSFIRHYDFVLQLQGLDVRLAVHCDLRLVVFQMVLLEHYLVVVVVEEMFPSRLEECQIKLLVNCLVAYPKDQSHFY